MAKNKELKTNAMRFLDRNKIPYEYQTYECDEFINLAITLSSEFFTLLEIKLLLFDGYSMELEAPQEVLDEYDKELNNFIHRFNNYKDEFTKLHS